MADSRLFWRICSLIGPDTRMKARSSGHPERSSNGRLMSVYSGPPVEQPVCGNRSSSEIGRGQFDDSVDITEQISTTDHPSSAIPQDPRYLVISLPTAGQRCLQYLKVKGDSADCTNANIMRQVKEIYQYHRPGWQGLTELSGVSHIRRAIVSSLCFFNGPTCSQRTVQCRTHEATAGSRRHCLGLADRGPQDRLGLRERNRLVPF